MTLEFIAICVGAGLFGFLAGLVVGVVDGRRKEENDAPVIILGAGQSMHLKTQPSLHKCRYCNLAFVQRKQLHDHVVDVHSNQLIQEGVH